MRALKFTWVGLGLLFFSALPQAQAQVCKNAAEEKQALTSFYNSLNGPEWVNSENWNSANPVNTWYGITVDDDGCVAGIELPANGLAGAVPASIATLKQLRTLNIENSQVSALPVEFGTLSKMRTLNVGRNFAISLPSSLSQLTKMSDLNLSGLSLTELPAFAATYPKLDILNLRNNQLTTLPAALFENSLTLKELHLTGNTSLESLPSQISLSQKLDILDIAGFAGTSIPQGIFSLSKLRELNISNSAIESIPNDILQLTGLRALNIGRARLQSWNPNIFALPKLETLIATGLVFSGITVGPEIAQADKLIALNLSQNNLESLPPEIGSLVNLESITLARNALTTLPSSFSNLSSLKSIDLSTNQLTQLPNLSAMTSLESLTVRSNQLTDLNNELAALTTLKDLRVDLNNLNFCQIKETLNYNSDLASFRYADQNEEYLTPVQVNGSNLSVSNTCASTVQWYATSDPEAVLGTGDNFVAPAPGTYQARITDDEFSDLTLFTQEVSI